MNREEKILAFIGVILITLLMGIFTYVLHGDIYTYIKEGILNKFGEENGKFIILFFLIGIGTTASLIGSFIIDIFFPQSKREKILSKKIRKIRDKINNKNRRLMRKRIEILEKESELGMLREEEKRLKGGMK